MDISTPYLKPLLGGSAALMLKYAPCDKTRRDTRNFTPLEETATQGQGRDGIRELRDDAPTHTPPLR